VVCAAVYPTHSVIDVAAPASHPPPAIYALPAVADGDVFFVGERDRLGLVATAARPRRRLRAEKVGKGADPPKIRLAVRSAPQGLGAAGCTGGKTSGSHWMARASSV
jgi:hypothetical protein